MRRSVAALAALVAVAAGCAGCGTAPKAPAARPPLRAAGAAVSRAPAAVAPLPRSVPVRLSIPAIGVDTPLVGLGLAADGTVEVPPIAAHAPAGWYEQSPTPGQVGPSVILGHVTVGRFGDGVFLHLARLRPGDRVTVTLHDGRSAGFTVDSVRTVAKAHFPTASVYGAVDRPQLRLITCGGPRGAGGYLDNVVVYASLTSTAG